MTTMIHGYDRLTGEPFASRSEVIGQNGMVATSHPLATQIGLDILKNGGNAIDAACAMVASTATMWDVLGWGGETQALIYHPNQKTFL